MVMMMISSGCALTFTIKLAASDTSLTHLLRDTMVTDLAVLVTLAVPVVLVYRLDKVIIETFV